MAEKKYYWLKLKRDFFKRHDIQIIEAMPNGKDYILFYLKLLCESIDHDGNLRFSDQIPYNEEMLAALTNTNVDVVRTAINVFTKLGMMEVLDDGTYFMNEVYKMVGSETEWAAKKRLYREKRGQIEDNTRTMSSLCRTLSEDKKTMSDKSIEYRDKSIDIYAEDISSVNDFTEEELHLLRDTWNQRADTHPVDGIRFMTKRYDNLRTCLRFCDKQRIFDEVSNIDTQAFFQKLKTEGRPVKFDWFFTPDNFQKVLEGNYRAEHKPKAADQKKTKFQNFDERSYDDDYYAELERKMMGE